MSLRSRSRPEPERRSGLAPNGLPYESVWDYPRPPRLEPIEVSITVELGGEVIAETGHGWRVLETSHPPTYYLPRTAFRDGVLRPAPGSSWCEWKGQARYFDLVAVAKVATKAAWNYPKPTAGYLQRGLAP